PCALYSETGSITPARTKLHGPVWPSYRRSDSTVMVCSEHTSTDADVAARSVLSNSDGIRFLPFGVAPTLGTTAAPTPTGQPMQLREILDRFALPENAVVLVDAPRRPSPLADLAVAAADRVVHVWRADLVSYARLTDPASGLGETVHVINLMDPTRRLQTDVHAMMRHRLGEQLLPQLIHRDEALPESVAANRNPFDYAPRSRSVQDLMALAIALAGDAEQGPRS
ncbi:MAG: cellulose synthase operon protein YhjQ/BcsQ, partial [Nevskiales bacterium]|nr:cellulose synthase operon protein YhjQ/BcsQ [Nevskiales bacterium]